MRSRGGTLRAQWLGKLLRDLRESAGLSLKDVAEHLMRDPSTISRTEIGTTPVRPLELRELMNLYDVDDPQLRDALESLANDIWVKGWWDSYASNIEVHIIDLAWLEARAEKLRNFSLPLIHGLLQTREYAEGVMRAVDLGASDEEIAQWLEFRMKRQEVLDRLDYTAILDETAFQRPYGGPKVMRDQLAHLLDMSERPNITIRVLPFSSYASVCPESTFRLLTMPAPFPVVAQVTTDAGAVYVEMPQADRFENLFTQMERHALDVEDSRVFIKTRMEQLV